MIAQSLVEEGLATPEQIEEAKDSQSKVLEAGRLKSIAEILIEQKILNRQDLENSISRNPKVH